MLKERYSAVILASAALKPNELHIEGENSITGIHHVRRLINWYNGSLDNDLDVKKEFDLDNATNFTIIGNGNISLDTIRILLKDPN